MPLFDFECKDCGAQFEELVFGESLVRCPKCSAQDVKKLPSRIAIGRSGGGRASSATPSFPVGGG